MDPLEVYDNGLLVMVACLFLYMLIFYGSAKGNTTRSAEDRRFKLTIAVFPSKHAPHLS
jgi:hypothetical protein